MELPDGRRVTPSEAEALGGCGNLKDWRYSLKTWYNGKRMSMNYFLSRALTVKVERTAVAAGPPISALGGDWEAAAAAAAAAAVGAVASEEPSSATAPGAAGGGLGGALEPPVGTTMVAAGFLPSRREGADVAPSVVQLPAALPLHEEEEEEPLQQPQGSGRLLQAARASMRQQQQVCICAAGGKEGDAWSLPCIPPWASLVQHTL